MLQKEYRITHKKDFEKIFNDGKGVFTDIMGVKLIPNNLKYSRFGIIISNKVSKKAVERNKIRRQIRSAIKLNLDKIKRERDIVIICKPEIKKLDYKNIEVELQKILRKVKLIDSTK